MQFGRAAGEAADAVSGFEEDKQVQRGKGGPVLPHNDRLLERLSFFNVSSAHRPMHLAVTVSLTVMEMANLDWHAERSDLSAIALLDRAPESEGIDLRQVRRYRHGRVREQMARHGVDAVLLSDPINIRYATGTRNMQIFSQRNAPSRYLVMTQSKSILFEFTGCLHLAEGYETVDEVRPSKTASFVAAGPDIADRERRWAAEMNDLIVELAGKGATLGLERLNAGTAIALSELGLRIVDAQRPVELARAIKSSEEMKCINASLRATEVGVGKLRDAATMRTGPGTFPRNSMPTATICPRMVAA
ncbi:aminopeptidase P family N-terminal domain-containing protein [Mesorhizobium sp. CC13]|uniref:aminopeptidase P family N-terminal domain-containing protein n=1 Tax=Mesorhizobium sp. CC13 TaxID=3029194 RepID=UPI0032665DA3